jgi:hypothetical protein
MAQISIEGSIAVGPQISGGTGVPSLVDTTTFATTPSPKMASVYTSKLVSIQSPSAYVALSGVGPGDDVTKANCYYARTSGPMKMRFTAVDTPANLVSEEWINGIFVHEYPDDHCLVKVEAMGSGQIETIASGNQ